MPRTVYPPSVSPIYIQSRFIPETQFPHPSFPPSLPIPSFVNLCKSNQTGVYTPMITKTTTYSIALDPIDRSSGVRRPSLHPQDRTRRYID